MSFKIIPSPETQSYHLHTTGRKQDLRNWRFLLVQGDNERHSFTCLCARFRTWLCYSFACLPRSRFCLATSRNTPPQRGRGWGRSVVDQRKTSVWARSSNLRACQTNNKLLWSKADSSPVTSIIKPFPSGVRDVIGRGKTPCCCRARHAKTTGDGSGSQFKRRTSHVTNLILGSEIYCISIKFFTCEVRRLSVWLWHVWP